MYPDSFETNVDGMSADASVVNNRFATEPIAVVKPAEQPLSEEELYTLFEQAISDRVQAVRVRLNRISQRLHPLQGDKLVSSLCRNSGIPCEMPALASLTDTSRPSDKRPVLTQACRISSVVSTENVLPLHGILAGNPTVQLEKNPGGELSLSSEPECLGLQTDGSTQVPEKQEEGCPPAGAFLSFHPAERGGLPERIWGEPLTHQPPATGDGWYAGSVEVEPCTEPLRQCASVAIRSSLLSKTWERCLILANLALLLMMSGFDLMGVLVLYLR